MADNRFTGKARIIARMKAIPVAIRIAMREELDKQAAFLVERIRPNVPRDHGDLADSLEWHRAQRSDRLSVIITEGETNDPEKKRKARAVEFGRPDMAAQPHFYPTYRANKKPINAALRRAVKRSVQKAVD